MTTEQSLAVPKEVVPLPLSHVFPEVCKRLPGLRWKPVIGLTVGHEALLFPGIILSVKRFGLDRAGAELPAGRDDWSGGVLEGASDFPHE